MKLTLATLLLPSLASLPYTAARVGAKTLNKLKSQKRLDPRKAHLALKQKSQTQEDPRKVHLPPALSFNDNQEDHRIIGGDVAEPGEFPFYAALIAYDELLCGGALIHEDIILTAAHCYLEDNDSVIIGAYSLLSPNEDAETRGIETRRAHPNYDDFTLENDVMVLKIDSPSLLPTITLNDDFASPSVGEDVVAIGLGVADDGELADVLRKVTVPIVAHDQCVAYFGDFNPIVEEVMMCAGLEEGGRDTCFGDSGGPLLEMRDGQYVHVGITSWGLDCAEPNSPGVYTRVSGVKSWIDEMICELSNNPPASCGSTTAPPPTNSTDPLDAGTCEDSTEEFFVDADIGSQACSWLSTNLSRYGFLCLFVDVAFSCPLTCDICDRLSGP